MCLRGGYMKLKCEIISDGQHEEGVFIYASADDVDAQKIKAFVESLSEGERKLMGYSECEARVLLQDEITCFIVEDTKVYALVELEKYQIKERLYKIEERLDNNFVKLNQSCVANIRKIKGFDASLGGALRVTFKNGYRDYVSRRQLKAVKERLGLKI